MAHEIFSVSTINTKRNLLAVSAVSIVHAFGWINLSALPFINGTVNSNTPISWILLAILIYLASSAYLHIKKDSDNQMLLPSLDEIKSNKKNIYEKLQSELKDFLDQTGIELDQTEIELDTSKIRIKHIKDLLINIDKDFHFDNGKINIKLLHDDIAHVLLKTVYEPISGPDLRSEEICEGIVKSLDYEIKYHKEASENLFSKFIGFYEQYEDLNKTKYKAKKSNNSLEAFEIGTPIIVTFFAFGCLIGNILCP